MFLKQYPESEKNVYKKMNNSLKNKVVFVRLQIGVNLVFIYVIPKQRHKIQSDLVLTI